MDFHLTFVNIQYLDHLFSVTCSVNHHRQWFGVVWCPRRASSERAGSPATICPRDYLPIKPAENCPHPETIIRVNVVGRVECIAGARAGRIHYQLITEDRPLHQLIREDGRRRDVMRAKRRTKEMLHEVIQE